MPDHLLHAPGGVQRLRDMGDGTFATVVAVVAPAVTPGNRSGSITAGGVAQQLAAANIGRRFLRVQNQSTGDLWVRDDGTAATADMNSIKVPAGALYEPQMVSGTSISIIGATTGQAFSAQEG